ncbi:OLC1v1002779C1 [Oldenlandia corymbosa var. corymbosa]|uniref:OLC1v1002779C1 n=1 Tax=Oldenlandia corymbosa var. corymbosa TaxID=529605 RepID=A0AAV1DAX6_OLDCO|nr:OLC1v1002779C1 [Oldenlandia corymbosa var. corymbosa]
MASAVLASGNESSWAQSGSGFMMGKLPYLSPNPNPKKKQKQFHQSANGGRKNHDFSPAVTQTASDDAYSFNQKPIADVHRNGFNHVEYMTYNVASLTKIQLAELRKRLASELEQVRNLRDRIHSSQFSGGNPNNLKSKPKKPTGITKRPISSGSGSNKDAKRFTNGIDKVSIGNGGGHNVDNEALTECGKILTKLMRHKFCRIFNTPVDAKALGLHDYHQIVKRPMDLGTVKSNLLKSLYLSPAEFAADVRLTFDNALLYNPKTDQVHGWAEFLYAKFEEMFKPIHDRIASERIEVLAGGGGSGGFGGLAEELQGSSWNHIPTPERPKKQKTIPTLNQTHSTASTPSNPPPPVIAQEVHSPVPTPSPVRAAPVIPQPGVRGTVGKQPKPRARDTNKRDMSIEEKHKLGVGLQSLPQEKMPQLLQIIRKRNEQLAQEGDEIELDIEALDTETLWELDRFVTNWKKMVSKTKRQALMNNNNTPAAQPSNSNVEAEGDGGDASDRNDSAKKPRKGDAGDEDVEIDDDMPDTSFPPVEIEKDEGGVQDHGNNASSSSSSSGSSSSESSSSSGTDSCVTF